MTLTQSLDRLPAFHHLVRWLGVRKAAGLVLRWFPRVRTLPGGGACYRCRYLETLWLADEIFNRNVYLKAIDAGNIATFADLGCNVGLFAVLLKNLTRRNDLKGIMIDANSEMVVETAWHLATNQLTQVVPIHGLVGAKKEGVTTDFYLLPSNLGSSQYPIYEPGKPPKGGWKKLTVPCLDLETAWLKHVGDQRCHLVKIDIEGSEANLFKTDIAFFRRVDTIILEWHKWIVSHETIHALLQEQGFTLIEILEEAETAGIAWYARQRSR